MRANRKKREGETIRVTKEEKLKKGNIWRQSKKR